MGTHPIFESDFDCLTEREYEHRSPDSPRPPQGLCQSPLVGRQGSPPSYSHARCYQVGRQFSAGDGGAHDEQGAQGVRQPSRRLHAYRGRSGWPTLCPLQHQLHLWTRCSGQELHLSRRRNCRRRQDQESRPRSWCHARRRREKVKKKTQKPEEQLLEKLSCVHTHITKFNLLLTLG